MGVGKPMKSMQMKSESMADVNIGIELWWQRPYGPRNFHGLGIPNYGQRAIYISV